LLTLFESLHIHQNTHTHLWQASTSACQWCIASGTLYRTCAQAFNAGCKRERNKTMQAVLKHSSHQLRIRSHSLAKDYQAQAPQTLFRFELVQTSAMHIHYQHKHTLSTRKRQTHTTLHYIALLTLCANSSICRAACSVCRSEPLPTAHVLRAASGAKVAGEALCADLTGVSTALLPMATKTSARSAGRKQQIGTYVYNVTKMAKAFRRDTQMMLLINICVC